MRSENDWQKILFGDGDGRKDAVSRRVIIHSDGSQETKTEIIPSKKGAVAGAAAGAALGSAVPVIGTAIGAVAGGVFGFIFGPED